MAKQLDRIQELARIRWNRMVEREAARLGKGTSRKPKETR